jgi:hypothetical protein
VLRTLDSEVHPSCIHGLKHFFGGSGVALRNTELLERPTKPLVAGLGLIQAPLLGIGPYLESGALKELLPDFQHKPLDVSVVVAHRRNLSRRVLAFMKWIENVLAPYLE